MNHLGQAPSTKTGKDHDAQKPQRIRTENGNEGAVQARRCFTGDLGKFLQSSHKTALTV